MIAEKIIATHGGELLNAAKEPVLKQIYQSSSGAPKKPRSENTIDSVSISADGDILYVYLDEEVSNPFAYLYAHKVQPQGLRSYKALTEGGDELYPEYFMHGGGFTGVQFDFHTEWWEAVEPIIMRALDQEVEALIDKLK